MFLIQIISLWKKKDPENPEMPQEDPALVGLSLKPLNRANTVATGLGTGTRKLQQQAHANRAAAAVANMNCIRSANDPINR